MAKSHYIVQRGRLSRFNFTFITDKGQLTGFIRIPINGQNNPELLKEARAKIRALAEEFASASRADDAIDPDHLTAFE